MKNLNELTMKELSKIAKDEYKLPLSITIDGKRKRYTKSELIEMIEVKRSQDYSSLYPEIKIGKSNAYGGLILSETIENEIPTLENMVKETKKLLTHGEVEKVKTFINHLQSEIRYSNNSLLMNKLSKTLLLIKSLLIMNKKEVL